MVRRILLVMVLVAILVMVMAVPAFAKCSGAGECKGLRDNNRGLTQNEINRNNSFQGATQGGDFFNTGNGGNRLGDSNN